MQEGRATVVPQLAVNIRAARSEAGLTQEQLARKLDVTLRTVSGWENGEHAPEYPYLSVLSLALGKHMSWFLAEHNLDGEQAA